MLAVLIFYLYFGSGFIKGLEFNGSYKISPKPCTILLNNVNTTGICTFVWDCLKSEGRHLGMCVDGFMFGSCCGHDPGGGGVSLTTNQDPLVSESNKEPVPYTTTPTTSTPNPTTPPPLETNLIESGEEELPFLTKSSTTTTTPITTTTTTTPPPPPTIKTTISPPTYINPLQPPPTESPSLFSNISYPTTDSLNPSTTPPGLCGTAPLSNVKRLLPQKRIVGGKEASYGQFPWQVSVRRTSFFGFSSTHRCGGALVSEQWVATAGHCVDDLMTSQIRVRLGEHDFSLGEEEYPHTERGVVKKVVHPLYNFFTYENDLALLKLSNPIPLNSTPHIVPICLPANDDLLIGENATVTGWGRLSEGGSLPSKLQHVSVPIISNSKCRDMFLKSGRMEYIPEIFLCAGYEAGGRDSCQGDSGGPLQVLGRDSRYFLAGIISWGIGCAEPNMPGVCTRISKFRDFILEHVRSSQ